MSRSTAKVLIVIATLILFAVIGISALVYSKALLMGAFLVWTLLYLLGSYFMRCPHCGRWPGKGDFFSHYCRWCGESLDD